MVKLRQVERVEEFIDLNGFSTEDLFNRSGAVLVKKGRSVPTNIYKMPIFCYQKESDRVVVEYYKKTVTVGEVDPQFSQIGDTSESSSPVISEQATKRYYELKEKLERVFDSSSTSISTYQNAIEILDETFKEPREELIRALWLLRATDFYTCDHSLSVYLLFLEALDVFKKYNMDDRFFSSFKSNSAKVNFDIGNLKRYAMGALLHDLGKLHIDEGIVHKHSSLTIGELDIIRLHPYYGVRTLKMLGVDDPQILDIVANHHYNYKVNDVSQSPLAQICNIVDIYDACRSRRSYKDAFSWEKTLGILNEEYKKSGWDSFIYEIVVSQVLVVMECRLQELEVV